MGSWGVKEEKRMNSIKLGSEKMDLFRWISVGCLAVLILFQLQGVWGILTAIWNFGFHGSNVFWILTGLMWLGGCICCVIALATNQQLQLLAIGTGLLAVSSLLNVFPLYGFTSFVISLLKLLSVAGVCVICLAYTQSSMAHLRVIFKDLWFLPVGLAAVLALFVLFRGGSFLRMLVWCGAAFAIPVYVMLSAGDTVEFTYESMRGATASSHTAERVVRPAAGAEGLISGRMGMVGHVLLLLLTFGIYQLIWIYQTTGYLNQDERTAYRNPTTKLLLCMFVPFYLIYWTYQSALRMDNLSRDHGVQSDLGMICLILSIFVPIIPPILIQAKMNELADLAEGVAAPRAAVQNDASYQQQGTNASAAAGTATSAAEALLRYKELLDQGIITEEEFQAKKRELLNL